MPQNQIFDGYHKIGTFRLTKSNRKMQTFAKDCFFKLINFEVLNNFIMPWSKLFSWFSITLLFGFIYVCDIASYKNTNIKIPKIGLKLQFISCRCKVILLLFEILASELDTSYILKSFGALCLNHETGQTYKQCYVWNINPNN